MIPVLYQIVIDTPLAHAVIYLVAAFVVAYAAWSGWRSVPIPAGGAAAAQLTQERIVKAVSFGGVGALLAGIGLYYALPAKSFLGGRGEGIPIHTYGILLMSGFMAAVALAGRLAEQEWRGEEGKKKREQVYDLAFWVFLGGIGGSKVLFMLVNWKDYGEHLGEYLTHPMRLVDCIGGGLVFYGGLIGASLATYLYCRRYALDFFRLGDVAIPTVSLGQCLGRLGCFSAGCCWGEPANSTVKWAVAFPGATLAKDLFGRHQSVASLAFQSQVADDRWVLPGTGQVFHQAVPGAVRISEWVINHGHTLPLHPTQLYESLGQLVVLIGLLTMRRYRRFHGQIVGAWLMAYAVLRSTVELFRGDLERGTLNGLLNYLGLYRLADHVPTEAWYNISISQFISICLFALGAGILVHRGRLARPFSELKAKPA